MVYFLTQQGNVAVTIVWLVDIHLQTVIGQLPFRTRIRFMVFNTTFNNISVISWLSVLLV